MSQLNAALQLNMGPTNVANLGFIKGSAALRPFASAAPQVLLQKMQAKSGYAYVDMKSCMEVLYHFW